MCAYMGPMCSHPVPILRTGSSIFVVVLAASQKRAGEDTSLGSRPFYNAANQRLLKKDAIGIDLARPRLSRLPCMFLNLSSASNGIMISMDYVHFICFSGSITNQSWHIRIHWADFAGQLWCDCSKLHPREWGMGHWTAQIGIIWPYKLGNVAMVIVFDVFRGSRSLGRSSFLFSFVEFHISIFLLRPTREDLELPLITASIEI